jgi:hypothetical protein
MILIMSSHNYNPLTALTDCKPSYLRIKNTYLIHIEYNLLWIQDMVIQCNMKHRDDNVETRPQKYSGDIVIVDIVFYD